MNDYQDYVFSRVIRGDRHKTIAGSIGITAPAVSACMVRITRAVGCRTSAQMIAYRTYLDAAESVFKVLEGIPTSAKAARDALLAKAEEIRGEPEELPNGSPVDLPDGVHHGEPTAYNHYKCRCGRCKARRQSYDREYWETVRGPKRNAERREARKKS